MKIELSDTSGLPEALSGFVAQEDGKTFLDLARAADDYTGLKGKLQTVTGESIDRRKALQAYEKLGTLDDIQTRLTKGADPAIIDQMRAQMAEKEGSYKAQLTKIVAERASSDLKAELARAGVVPEGLELLAAVASRQIAVEDDGGIRIVGADGKPMIGSGANGGATLADLAAQLAKSNPRLVADGGVGGGGRQPGAGQSKTGKTMTTAAFNALPAKDRAKAMADGVNLTD